MTGDETDAQAVARAASLFERAADRLAENLGDEYTASGLLLALGAFVETRWGTHAVHQLLTDTARQIGTFDKRGE